MEEVETGTGDEDLVHEGERADKEAVKGEQVAGEHAEGEHVIEGEHLEGEHVEGEHVEGEHVEGEHVEGEHVEGEHVQGEHVEGEHVEGEYAKGENAEGEHVEGEHVEVEGEHIEGEHAEGEHVESEQIEGQVTGEEIPDLENIVGEQTEEKPPEDTLPIEEEDVYVEEPPPDPAAPYNLSDSTEALRPKFELRNDQLAEVEQLWETYQNYTPAYSDLDNFITEKELVYMLKCLMLLPHTPEQLQELIVFCIRPPHPKGHITFDQFVNIVTLRQRDVVVEEELRSALKVFDRDNCGEISRDELREVLIKQGHKMSPKMVDNLIKEVDMSNDGILGVEDIVSTMCIDLNPDDIIMLRNAVYPPETPPPVEEEF